MGGAGGAVESQLAQLRGQAGTDDLQVTQLRVDVCELAAVELGGDLGIDRIFRTASLLPTRGEAADLVEREADGHEHANQADARDVLRRERAVTVVLPDTAEYARVLVMSQGTDTAAGAGGEFTNSHVPKLNPDVSVRVKGAAHSVDLS